jgi:hypothetical protein
LSWFSSSFALSLTLSLDLGICANAQMGMRLSRRNKTQRARGRFDCSMIIIFCSRIGQFETRVSYRCSFVDWHVRASPDPHLLDGGVTISGANGSMSPIDGADGATMDLTHCRIAVFASDSGFTQATED